MEIIIASVIIGFCLLTLAMSSMMTPRDAPPRDIYDRYGNPIPLGRSRYFDVRYLPDDNARSFREAILVGVFLMFCIGGILAYHFMDDNFKKSEDSNTRLNQVDYTFIDE